MSLIYRGLTTDAVVSDNDCSGKSPVACERKLVRSGHLNDVCAGERKPMMTGILIYGRIAGVQEIIDLKIDHLSSGPCNHKYF
jgi:hypothetical protein